MSEGNEQETVTPESDDTGSEEAGVAETVGEAVEAAE